MIYRLSELEGEIEIKIVDLYGDGTVWASMVDSQGRHAVACIDGRDGSDTRYRIFVGARHPSRPEAVLIDLGSEEEGIFVSLVSEMIDAVPPRFQFTEYGLEIIRDALVRIGSVSR